MNSSSSDRPFPDLIHVFTKNDLKSNVDLKRYPRWVIYVILLGFLGFLIVLLPQILQNGPNSYREIGESPGFLKASNLILETRNSDVNPCDDFYEYVCGKYAKNNPIPHGELVESEAYKIQAKVQYQLLDLLESTEKSSSEAISKVKIIYNSCIREKGVVTVNSQAHLNLIKEIGHWPILMGDQEAEIDLQEMFEKMHSLGVQFPWKIHGIWNKTKKCIEMFFLFSGMPYLSENPSWSDELSSDTERELADRKKGVTNKIQKLAQEFGYVANPNFDRDVEEMFEFESQLDQLQSDLDNSDEIERYSQPFDKFNEQILNEMGLDLKKIYLAGIPEFAHGLYNSTTPVWLETPQWFFKNISRLIKKTEPRILVNYIMYNIPASFNTDAPENGIWEECKGIAMTMKKAVGALYARKYFPPESRDIIVEMTESLRETVLEMFEENEWMDEETKKEAKKKAKEMIAHIGYNELAFDDEKLDKYYEEIDVSNYNDFFSMTRSLDAWTLKEEYMKYITGSRREDFFGDSTIVNAVFCPDFNAILIPAAYSQFPNFLVDQPLSLNYGAIGSIIGHEITHGFDNYGKNFDELGRRRNWWDNITLKKFEEKSKCLVEQYSAIEVPGTDGLHINGNHTLGENIADHAGLREAFRAYKKYVKRHGKEPKLPGVDFTDDQLFFVGYGNINCIVMKKKMLVDSINFDGHSPDKTNVVLQNMEEFSEAFKCPVGSPMNPEKKCLVW